MLRNMIGFLHIHPGKRGAAKAKNRPAAGVSGQ